MDKSAFYWDETQSFVQLGGGISMVVARGRVPNSPSTVFLVAHDWRHHDLAINYFVATERLGDLGIIVSHLIHS